MPVLSQSADFLNVTTYSNLPALPAFGCLSHFSTTGAESAVNADQSFPAVFISKPPYPCEYIHFCRSRIEGSPPVSASNVTVVLESSGPLHLSGSFGKHSVQRKGQLLLSEKATAGLSQKKPTWLLLRRRLPSVVFEPRQLLSDFFARNGGVSTN